MTIYMAISADKYELPLFVTCNSEELGRKFGTTKNVILSESSRAGKGKTGQGTKRGYTFVKVEVDND